MGVMLFAMIVGEFPFENVQATLDGEYEWPDLDSYSSNLISLVEYIFELNPVIFFFFFFFLFFFYFFRICD
jgi:hypothetical protein